jgi:DNA-binding MarR family transcriptional regulator
MELNKAEKLELERIIRALEHFRHLSHTMPIQQVIVFLTLCLNEGKSFREITEIIPGAKTGTMSRQMNDLGPRNRHFEPGFNLITSRQDPMELRQNQYYLTDAGLKLAESILSGKKVS